MINIPIPPDPHIINNNPAAIQEVAAPEVISVMERDDATDFVKKLILGYLVNKSIKENETQQISTGVEIFDMQKERPIVAHNVDTQQFAASVNKLPVTLLVLQDLRLGRVRHPWTSQGLNE